MTKPNTLSPIDFYKEIETFYLKGKYTSILEFESDYISLDSSVLDSEKLKYLAEMFSNVYRELALDDKKHGLTKQFKTSLRYVNLGGSDSDILNWKLSLEEDLFMRYVKVNKYILYLILLAVLVVNLDFIPPNSAYLPTLTAIAIIWYIMNYVMNYVMNCRVKRLYLKLMHFIYT